jgi:hypothetical protein
MSLVTRLLLLLVFCASGLGPAHGMERDDDLLLLFALQAQTDAVNVLERDLLVLIESTPADDRFDLYRTYNQLMGAWLQVDLAQALLAASVLAASMPEDEAMRITLRDQARFALWDLDDARRNLAQTIPAADQSEHARINEAIRAQLFEVKALIGRLLADQCALLDCVADP